jgi:hypothetical protein
VQIPTKDTVALLNFPQKWPSAPAVSERSEAAAAYRVAIWARSSPHLVNATRKYTSSPPLLVISGYALTGCFCFYSQGWV